MRCLLTTYALIIVLSQTNICADDSESKAPRWDDKFFGFTIGKPEKGRRWVVVRTVPFSSGDILREGDEINTFNKKRVTTKDDLLQMLRDAEDTITLGAKRKVGRKTVTDRAMFTRTTRWEATTKAFTVSDDPINELQVWRVKEISEALSDETRLLPEIIFENDHPLLPVLRFQYRDADWLFIRKLTVKHGDKKFIFDHDELNSPKTEVLLGSGIKEWFSLTGEKANELLKHIGTNPSATSTIRLHGRDYYKDIELTKLERSAFIWVSELWTLGQQRKTDLTKGQ